MEAAELKEITRSLGVAVGGPMAQFKQAAAESNKSLTNVVKDLFKAISAQGEHTAEASDRMDEVVVSTRQTASKVDTTNLLLEQSINVQNNMYSVLKTMGYDIKVMNDNVSQINSGSMLGTMLQQTGIGDFLKRSLGMLGASMLGTAGTAALQGYLGGGETPMQVSGNSNEAMSFFQTKGWSKEQSAGIVGNLMVESENFSSRVLSGEKKGDGGTAVGVAQWHPDRQKLFESVMHKPLIGSSFQEQLEFVNWELNNSEAKAGERLRTAKDASSAATIVDEAYERSSGEHRAKRIANAENLVSQKAETTAQSATPATTGVNPQTPVTASPTTPGALPTPQAGGGGEGHGGGGGHGGIISGAMGHGGGEEQGKLSGVQPGILEKFKEIQGKAGAALTVTSGFRDPAHNAAVGGAQNSAHTRGNAVDVTFNGGIDETNRLIKTASDAGIGGIGVYRPGVLHFDTEGKRAWGPNYHSDSIPDWARPAIQAHLGGSGGSTSEKFSETGGAGGVGGMGLGVRPLTSFASMTGSGVSPNLGNMGVAGSYAQAAMGGMHSVQNMGGFGGAPLGGMAPVALALASSLAPVLLNAIQSGAQPAPEYSAEMQTAEMTAPPPAEAPDMLKQVEIERQIEQQNINKAMIESNKESAQQQQAVYINQASSGQSQSNLDYNHESDRGWPEWASMIGGWHWEETKSIKKNMWS